MASVPLAALRLTSASQLVTSEDKDINEPISVRRHRRLFSEGPAANTVSRCFDANEISRTLSVSDLQSSVGLVSQSALLCIQLVPCRGGAYEVESGGGPKC